MLREATPCHLVVYSFTAEKFLSILFAHFLEAIEGGTFVRSCTFLFLNDLSWLALFQTIILKLFAAPGGISCSCFCFLNRDGNLCARFMASIRVKR